MTEQPKPESERDPLDRVQELYGFLQGEVPEGYKIRPRRVPRLTADQAWTVVWYVQEMHWKVPDYIERCNVCGELFNTRCEGGYTENGPPFHLCDSCEHLEGEGKTDG